MGQLELIKMKWPTIHTENRKLNIFIMYLNMKFKTISLLEDRKYWFQESKGKDKNLRVGISINWIPKSLMIKKQQQQLAILDYITENWKITLNNWKIQARIYKVFVVTITTKLSYPEYIKNLLNS